MPQPAQSQPIFRLVHIDTRRQGRRTCALRGNYLGLRDIRKIWKFTVFHVLTYPCHMKIRIHSVTKKVRERGLRDAIYGWAFAMFRA